MSIVCKSLLLSLDYLMFTFDVFTSLRCEIKCFSDLRLKCSLAEYGKKNNNLLFICNDTLPVKMRFDPER